MFLLLKVNKIFYLNLFCLIIFSHYFNLLRKFKYNLFFIQLNIKGLGYRFFIFRNILYITLGMSHFFCLNIPNSIIYFIRNRTNLFLYSRNRQVLMFFCLKIKKLKLPFKYKSRGFTQIKDWNLFIKKRITLQK